MAALIAALLRGGRYKSGSELAREIGIHQTYVSKLSRGVRPVVGLDAIESVVRRLPISRDYFYVPGPAEIDHRPFLRRVGDDGQFDHWEKFLQTDVGLHMALAEEETLRSAELGLARNTPAETLRALVLAYRTGQRHHAATAREGVPAPARGGRRVMSAVPPKAGSR
jgi:transcriptional regulator with XRE-family HTH domain